MHTIPDLDIPEVKPAIELYRGRRRQKVSPRYTHARLQSRLSTMLDAWGRDRGRVGTEWRFYFIERGDEPPSSLVPDVAYLSYARLPRDAEDEAEQPRIAPDIAIEILSPDDRDRDVCEKIDLYRAYGTPCVVVVDPAARSIAVYDLGVEAPRSFTGDVVATIVTGFSFDLAALFSP